MFLKYKNSLSLMLAASLFAIKLNAQTFVPVNVTGFNHDLIANGSGGNNRAAATTTITFDGVNIGGDNVMYSKDFRGNNNPNTAPPYGLPIDRTILSVNLSGAKYTLAHYDSLNALVLKTNGSSGTLKLETPGVFSKIAFLGSSAEGASTFNVTLNFSDGTNTSANFTVPDWFDGSGFAIKGIGRVTRTQVQTQGPDQFTGTSENPRLYDNQITLNAPFNTKILTTITFTKTSAGGSTAILAINGITAVNAPAAPVATAATNINFPSFTANWQAAVGASAYILDVSISPTFSTLLPNYNNRNVGNVLSFNVTGLVSSQTYYYRVRASNVSGISPSSNTINVPFPDCPPGDYSASTQGRVDSFLLIYPNCKQISGNLNFADNSSITNLNGFINIEKVTSQLNIVRNAALTNLDGLQNINSVGGNLWIQDNALVSKINNFNKLTSCGLLNIADNKELVEISGFNALSQFPFTGIQNNPKLTLINIVNPINQINGILNINNNRSLKSIAAFGNVPKINGSLIITNNDSLTNLNAFSQLTSVTELSIQNNATLTNLDALNKLNTLNGSLAIAGNAKLLSIVGLSNIPASHIKNTGLNIQFNALLSICELPNICEYLQGSGPRTISGNAPGCESDQAVKNACSALAAPVALAATGITSSGFTANWQAISGATKYLLDVSTTSNFSSFENGYNNRDVGNVLTFGITGLSASTIYYYRVRANNASSTSPSSNVIQATTLAAVLSAPTALPATNITTSGFTANWQTISDATKYLLDVSTNSNFSSFENGYNNRDVGNVLTFGITGLSTSTIYYYRVRANNASSTSPNSNVIQATTLTAGLTAPVALSATSINSSGFTANWQASSGATKYLLDVSTNSNFSSFENGYNNRDVGNVLNFGITGLSANTTYYYRVRANNTSSTSTNSNVRANNTSSTSANSNVVNLTTLDNSIGPKPITVNGFNADIIANGSGGQNRAIATTTNEIGGFVLYSKDFRGNNNPNVAPTYGLPDNGIILNASVPGFDYQLANYTGNNALVLKNQNESGSLTLSQQDTFTKIGFLALSEGNSSMLNVRLNFSDGTFKDTSFVISDWFNRPDFAMKGIGRINRIGDIFAADESTENPRLYHHEMTLQLPFSNKRLINIFFSKTSTDGRAAVFAISGIGRGNSNNCNVIIPDAPFKNYLLANTNINTNRDNEIQCSEAADFTGEINCPNLQIKDLTGIEAFINLTSLQVNNNQLSNLDISKNIKLKILNCSNNQLNKINAQLNTQLMELYCSNNKLTELDVDANINLEKLGCNENLIKNLDINKNVSLTHLWCYNNKLVSLNLRNGINEDMALIEAHNNPDLTCIKVDNENYSNANWRSNPFRFDAQHVFKEECGPCDEWREKLNSNFLVSSSACAGDSIHLIDYSQLEIGQDAEFSWDFGNGTTSTKRDPVISYDKEGNYVISLIVSNPDCQGLVISKNISVLSCLNNNLDALNSAILYPNPNSGNMTVKLSLHEPSPILMRVVKVNGSLFKEYRYSPVRFLDDQVQIDEPGIYMIVLIHNGGTAKVKAVVY
ncbi:MAG: PKD domain-containing protein [Saprospiraceae bacterium]|nr:PKD domain-containing protein [Candidatus Vicinibacter affinis]